MQKEPDLKMPSRASCLSRVGVLLAAVLVTTSITMSGEWGEEGVTYGQIGKDVTLTCAGGSSSSSVTWRWNGAPILPEGSAVHQGQLFLAQAQRNAEGLYSCHDAGGTLLGSTTLHLGRLPEMPSISCQASDYENFSCFWASSVETFLPTKYITSYRKRQLLGNGNQSSPSGDVRPCVQDPSRPFSCTVSKSEFWSTYRMNVTEVNPLGASFRLLDVTLHAIIKPDPPEGLRVDPVPFAPQQLLVSWAYPSSWPKKPSFQLQFQIQYRPIVYSSWSVVETGNLSKVITDVVAGLVHVVQVSARDFLDAGSWSEWSPEAWGMPASGQVATVGNELESPAEDPSLAPNESVATGRSDPTEKVAVLVLLGVFAFFVLAVILVFAFLMWTRMKKQSKEATKNHDLLAAAIHMKALPKAQIL
uniref:Interleukin-11 receptor subunit alpha n=1 Tax=Anolis carolinensis TaxID=28377 RepID=H9GCN9_ANOCA|nr:PREDICTED: interleukin-11 receptor subunit alpha [Anolis carolinensis]|eukprot:XP_008119566.1 PREDICTED: interleukin-11 receptor subunit alpha [Anolis carolinensis]